MIFSNDPKLNAAINNLRINPKLSLYIKEMDGAGLNIFVVQAPPYLQNSATDTDNRPVYRCYINTKGDADISLKKYKITLTTEENSIAHELGHIYFDYLVHYKKPASMTKALKPPGAVARFVWEGILDEITARRFELYSRPPGTFVPLQDPPADGFLRAMDFRPFAP